ncbi:MAG: glycosyltransferase [bacterium]
MRILYITPSFQHPSMRGPTRCYHFIKELSPRHEITLLSLTGCEVPSGPMQEMASYTKRIQLIQARGASAVRAADAGAGLPVVHKYFQTASRLSASVQQMKQAFLQLMQQESYDVVLFHGKSIYSVIEDWSGRPIVVDFCDATSMRYLAKMRYASLIKRPALALRYLQFRQIEKKIINKTPHLAFVSWRDREAVLGACPGAEVIPIGVDHQYWKRKTHQPRPHCVAFTGVMNYAPNEDAAIYLLDKILPLVRRSLPQLEVLIVGRDPAPALMQKAQQSPNVTVTGFVDDMRPYLERATVFAAPLRYGSGIQNKILEAMSMAVPVITTTIAADGLRIDGAGEPPVHVADGEKEFAERLLHLLAEQKERDHLSAEGRRFVENHFIWARSAKKLEKMCCAAAGSNSAATKGEHREGDSAAYKNGYSSYEHAAHVKAGGD